MTWPEGVVIEGGSMPLCRTCGEQPAAAHGLGECRWCYAGISDDEAEDSP